MYSIQRNKKIKICFCKHAKSMCVNSNWLNWCRPMRSEWLGFGRVCSMYLQMQKQFRSRDTSDGDEFFTKTTHHWGNSEWYHCHCNWEWKQQRRTTHSLFLHWKIDSFLTWSVSIMITVWKFEEKKKSCFGRHWIEKCDVTIGHFNRNTKLIEIRTTRTVSYLLCSIESYLLYINMKTTENNQIRQFKKKKKYIMKNYINAYEIKLLYLSKKKKKWRYIYICI